MRAAVRPKAQRETAAELVPERRAAFGALDPLLPHAARPESSGAQS